MKELTAKQERDVVFYARQAVHSLVSLQHAEWTVESILGEQVDVHGLVTELAAGLGYPAEVINISDDTILQTIKQLAK